MSSELYISYQQKNRRKGDFCGVPNGDRTRDYAATERRVTTTP